MPLSANPILSHIVNDISFVLYNFHKPWTPFGGAHQWEIVWSFFVVFISSVKRMIFDVYLVNICWRTCHYRLHILNQIGNLLENKLVFFACRIGKFIVGSFKIDDISMVLDFTISSCLTLGTPPKGFSIASSKPCNDSLSFVLIDLTLYEPDGTSAWSLQVHEVAKMNLMRKLLPQTIEKAYP
mgnify:CR=1 FL=1